MYNRYWSTFLLLLGALLAFRGLAAFEQQCVPIEGYTSCACKLNETKEVINLLPLAPKNASDRPRFTTNETSPEKEGWLYSFNPCDGFSKFVSEQGDSCKNVAVGCWTNSPPKKCEDLGDPKSATFDYTLTDLSKFNLTLQSNLSLTFTSLNDTLTKNRAVIYLVCNSNMTNLNESSFHFLEIDHTSDKSHTLYYFTLESRCACPDLCGAPPKKTPSRAKDEDKDDTWLIVGVSIGAVVVLVLVILAVICCRTQRSGYTSV